MLMQMVIKIPNNKDFYFFLQEGFTSLLKI